MLDCEFLAFFQRVKQFSGNGGGAGMFVQFQFGDPRFQIVDAGGALPHMALRALEVILALVHLEPTYPWTEPGSWGNEPGLLQL